jgi:hypothetical protein
MRRPFIGSGERTSSRLEGILSSYFGAEDRFDSSRRFAQQNLLDFAVTAPAQFRAPFLQPFGPDRDAQWEADEIAVFEFDSRPLISVI